VFRGQYAAAWGFEKFEGAHVVQAVGEFDQDDADVVDHGEKHLADVLGLAGFGGSHVQASDLGDAFDEMRDFRAEALFDPGDRILGVFDGVVEESGGERGGVQANIRENVRDFEQMNQVRVTGAAELAAVALGGDFISASNHPGIFGGAILAKFLE